MELYPDCITCVINNLLHVAERVLPDPEAQMILLKKVMERFSPELRTDSSAPHPHRNSLFGIERNVRSGRSFSSC